MEAGTWGLSVCTKTWLFPIADWRHNGAHGPASPTCLHIHLLHLQQKPGINSLCSGLKRVIEKKKTCSGFTPPQTPRVKLWSSSWWVPQNTHCAAGVSVKSQRQPMQTAVIAIWFRRARKLTACGVVSNAESFFFFNYLFWSSPESLCEQALKVEQTKQCAQSRGKQRKWHGYSTFQFARSRLHRWQSPLRRCR